MIEAQIEHLRQLLRYRRAQGAVAVEPRAERQAAFVAEVDRGSEGSVWTAGGCLSWYTDATGRNSALWPNSVRAYQRRLRQLDPGDWVLEMPWPSRERELALA